MFNFNVQALTSNGHPCRGLCKKDWYAKHEQGTQADWTQYWKGLSAVERQVCCVLAFRTFVSLTNPCSSGSSNPPSREQVLPALPSARKIPSQVSRTACYSSRAADVFPCKRARFQLQNVRSCRARRESRTSCASRVGSDARRARASGAMRGRRARARQPGRRLLHVAFGQLSLVLVVAHTCMEKHIRAQLQIQRCFLICRDLWTASLSNIKHGYIEKYPEQAVRTSCMHWM